MKTKDFKKLGRKLKFTLIFYGKVFLRYYQNYQDIFLNTIKIRCRNLTFRRD